MSPLLSCAFDYYVDTFAAAVNAAAVATAATAAVNDFAGAGLDDGDYLTPPRFVVASLCSSAYDV